MSAKVNQDLVQRYRHINVEDGYWYEGIMDSFVRRMEQVGFTVNEEPLFSGFYCQGDGASFFGSVTDPRKFMEMYDLIHRFPATWAVVTQGIGTFGVYVTSNAARGARHSGTMMVEAALSWPLHGSHVPPLRQAMDTSILRAAEDEVVAIEEYLTPLLRGLADDLYRELEQEYEYQTSDEAVIGTLEMNDLITDELEFNNDEDEL